MGDYIYKWLGVVIDKCVMNRLILRKNYTKKLQLSKQLSIFA